MLTRGVPLARELYPSAVAYVYLNQSIQLVVINPILLVLMELGTAAGAGAGGAGRPTLARVLRKALIGTATNPLVVLTAAGLAAGRAYPTGLPPILAALSKQIGDAGPFLGFLCLGFAMGALGGTSTQDVRHAAVLCAAKLVLMPNLYMGAARLVGCAKGDPLLAFLGSLPASASVYSLTVTRDLSPRVVGPLVPASMLLSVGVTLAPLFEATSRWQLADALAIAIAAVGVLALVSSGGDARPKGKAE